MPDEPKINISNADVSDSHIRAANLNSSSESTAAESSTYLLKDPKLRDILLSDAGVESLLVRLKQSIHTSKEVAAYIKKMATVEAEHSAHLKKASRTMSDIFKRPEIKKGTCQNQIVNIMKSTDRYGDAGATFIDTMHKIHDELLEVVRSMERQRKVAKETALRHEKNLLDAEREVEKAKAKYDGACEDLEKARTNDPSSKNVLNFKNKSEDELHRRMTVSEVDYQQRVDACQRIRHDLVNKLRVDDINRLQGLALECDNALSLQLIRFSNLFETLQLNRGFVIAPIKPQNSPTANLSIKDMASKIDSELDFYNFVCSIPKTKPSLNRPQIQFKKHPSLGGAKGGTGTNSGPSQVPKNQFMSNPISNPMGNSLNKSVGSAGLNSSVMSSGSAKATTNHASPGSLPGMDISSDRKVSSSSIPTPSVILSGGSAKTGPILGKAPADTASGPVAQSVVPTVDPGVQGTNVSPPRSSGGTVSNALYPAQPAKSVYDPSMHGLAVYGTPLEDLLDYEEGTVPRVVYQCVQAIDNFGLEVEGIYRTNGNKNQVADIRNEFDIDAASVDLLRPKDGVNDIHSVASALKQYFLALPDPLLTKEFHQEFLQAASITDDVRRRDSIHAIINNLPDPNYTTLRYLVFHLYRVQERSGVNKMDVTNLGIIWGPVMMKADHQNVGEMAVQSRVLQTILVNAYAIFEAE